MYSYSSLRYALMDLDYSKNKEEVVECEEIIRKRAAEDEIDLIITLTDSIYTKTLIACGVNIHIRDDEAIIQASASGYTEAVEILIEHGANFHTRNYHVIARASWGGHIKTIKLLLKYNIDIHANNNNALISACINHQFEAVKFILDLDDIETFLDIDIEKFDPKIQNEFIQRVEKKATEKDITAIQLASLHANLSITNLLL